MPRRIKGVTLKGRKVRDLTTGRFYTTKRFVSAARKAKKQFEEQREEKLASLRKATAASCTKEARKRRSQAQLEHLERNPEHRKVLQRRVLKYNGWDNPEHVARRLRVDRDAHSVKKVIINGVECTYRKTDSVKDGELSVVYMDCERKPTVPTGVSVG